MIDVVSTVPLYVEGQVVTEFQTDEAHFRELVRVHGNAKVQMKPEAKAEKPAKEPAKKAEK